MPLQIRVAAKAAAQIRTAARWWLANRPAAPDALASDIHHALMLLSEQPGIGARHRGAALPDVRRLYLSRVRYFVYYRVEGDVLQVLALWHASREGAPRL